MSDPLKKVQSGDPLVVPAQAYNAFIDSAKDFQQRTRHVGQQATPGYRSASIVLVKNESAGDRDRFDILGLGEPVILPDAGGSAEQSFKNTVALRGEMPDTTLHDGKFAILAEPLAVGAIGRAHLAGVTAVRLRLEDSAQEVARAEIIDADATALQPETDGSAQVLWHQRQTGDVWAIVRLGNAAPTGVWVQIASTEASAGEYSSWQEVELTDDGSGGLAWSAVADGLAGPGDGVLYEVNGIEDIPADTVVQAFPNPAYDPQTGALPAWLCQYEHVEVGEGGSDGHIVGAAIIKPNGPGTVVLQGGDNRNSFIKAFGVVRPNKTGSFNEDPDDADAREPTGAKRVFINDKAPLDSDEILISLTSDGGGDDTTVTLFVDRNSGNLKAEAAGPSWSRFVFQWEITRFDVEEGI